MELPLYNKSTKTGRKGINILREIVEDKLDWHLRETNQEDDFGIDGYIDLISELGQITGKSIAVQVKSGNSFFKNKAEFGWKYYGEMRHLNYYLNNDLPVLIIIVDVNNRAAYWALIDANQTEKHDVNWSIIVPYNQELNEKTKPELLEYVSPTVDYVSQLDEYWRLNKMLKSAKLLIFIATKEDIKSNNYKSLIDGFERLAQNKEIILKHRENVEILIHGYDDDPRNLHEIPEVVEWVKNIVQKVEGLSFFLINDLVNSQFLKVFIFSQVQITRTNQYKAVHHGILQQQVFYNTKNTNYILESLYVDLNNFHHKHKLPIEINIEISNNLVNLISGGEYLKQKNNKA